MPKTVSASELDTFLVTMRSDHSPAGEYEVEVRASYFQHDNGFVVFKQDGGSLVHALRHDLVTEIELVRPRSIAIPAEDASILMSALLNYQAQDSTTETRLSALMHSISTQYKQATAGADTADTVAADC